jgi:hypothetical protein
MSDPDEADVDFVIRPLDVTRKERRSESGSARRFKKISAARGIFCHDTSVLTGFSSFVTGFIQEMLIHIQ